MTIRTDSFRTRRRIQVVIVEVKTVTGLHTRGDLEACLRSGLNTTVQPKLLVALGVDVVGLKQINYNKVPCG